MRARKITVVLLALPVVVVGCGAAERAWVEVKSANFVVASNAGEKQARRAAGQFERIRTVFQKGLNVRVDPGKPFIVIAVRDEKSLKEILPRFYERKDLMHPAGVFQAGREKHYVAMRMDAPGEQPYHTVYHEYVHMIVNLNFQSLPAWLNEGLAEFYGNSVIEDKQVGVGRPGLWSLRLLQQNKLLPLATLLALDHFSPHYNERDKVSIFYAQSWALTHYLVFVDKNRKLKLLLQELAKQTADIEAARLALGDLKDLEQKLDEYVRRSSYAYWHIQMPTELDESKFQTRELTEAESAAVRGDFLVHSSRPKEAARFLEEALRLDPRLAGAHESMGLLYLKSNQQKKAIDCFLKALNLNSQSYLAHYYCGAHRVWNDADAGSGPPAEVALKKAVELNPNFAPAYAALAALYSKSGEQMALALDMALKASRLEPGDITYRVGVGDILLNLARFAEAEKLGQALLAAARSPVDRDVAERFIEDTRRRKSQDEERKELERQIAEAGSRREAESKASERQNAGAGRAVETNQNQPQAGKAGTTATNTEIVSGTIGRVECQLSDAMLVPLQAGAQKLLLHSRNFRNITYFSSTWTPPDPFLPCSQLQGLTVRVKYYPLTGMRYDGEIESLEVLKGK